jgi:hypothetical protein
MRKKTKLILLSIVFSILLVLLAFFIVELIFKSLLFSDWGALNSFRKPFLYADWYSDNDYWKLQYIWQDKFPPEARYYPPEEPHPYLGWIGDFSGVSFIHNKSSDLRERRPVLLYGDSFAQGMDNAIFIQDVLNNDHEFSEKYCMLNYGVAGYGVDQIYLLFNETIDLYKDAFFIFSFMIHDIDRCVLSVRVGQKPYFEIVDGKLELKGVPINPDPTDFFENNPPQIKSYLWNKFLYQRWNFLSGFRAYLRGDKKIKRKKIELNEKIFSNVIEELKRRNLEFVFLVFHPEISFNNDPDWRGIWLKNFFRKNEIDLIWSRNILENRDNKKPLSGLFQEGNRHPTTLYNQIIANEIKKMILKQDVLP